MAGGTASFGISFGAQLDPTKLLQQLQQLQSTVKNQTLDINLKANVAQGISGTKNLFSDLGASAENLEKITVKYEKFREIATGQEFKIAVSTYKELRGATGELVKETENLNQAEINYYKTSKELQSLGKAEATVNYGQKLRETERIYKSMDKSVEKVSQSTDEFLSKSVNMSGEQVEATKNVALQIQDEVKAYNDLIAVQDRAGALQHFKKIEILTKEFNRLEASTHRSASALQNWGTSIVRAIKNTIAYGFSLGMIRKAQQMLNEAIQFTIDLNTEMTKIMVLQAEGAQSPEEIRSLAQSYNQLAKELGVTTMEIAQGSVEWLRQGKTIEETGELLRSTAMMAKLGNIELAEATEFLTSTLNGFKMSSEEAISIVDKLVHVDNIAATSVRELSTALRYVSAVAHESGVSFEQLVSYITVLSETTRLNAEQIGQSLKTIFTRMQDIKQGKIDEDGLGLNNVESALARVDIELRDSETSFRDLSSVLEELSGKWSTLNEVEQANIAKAIAGVRQQNMFRILMTEMGSALEYQAEQAQSAGTSLDRYGIYLDSIEAKQAEFKATLEGLYMDEELQDMIKGFIELGTTVLNLIDKMGGLKTVVLALTTAIIVLNSQKIQSAITGKILNSTLLKEIALLKWGVIETYRLAGAKAAASVATKGLAASMKALFVSNPVGWIMLAIGALVTFVSYLGSLETKAEKATKAIEDFKQEISEIKQNTSSMKSLVKEYEELNSVLDDSTASSKEQEQAQQKLYDVMNKMQEIVPTMAGHWDKFGNFIVDASVDVRQLITDLEDLEKTRRKDLETQAKIKGLDAQYYIGQGMSTSMSQALEMRYEYMQRQKTKSAKKPESERLARLAREAEGMYFSLLREAQENFYLMGEDAQITFVEGFSKNFNWEDLFKPQEASVIEDVIPTQKHWSEYAGMGTNAISDEQIASQLSIFASGLDDIANARKKIADNQWLTEEEINKLHNYGIEIDILDGKQVLLNDSTEDLVEVGVKLAKNSLGPLSKEQTEYLRKLLRSTIAQEEAKGATVNLANATKKVKDALEEQNEKGEISYETAMKLAESNIGLEKALEFTGSGFKLNATAAREALTAQLQLELVEYGLADAALKAGKAQFELARDAIMASDAAMTAKIRWLGLLDTLRGFYSGGFMPSGDSRSSSGGGGGGGGPSAEELEYDRQIDSIKDLIDARKENIDAIEEEIDRLEERKDALKEQLDDYKDYIATQKEILQLKKEEIEYNRELSEKNEDLSKIQQELAIISLDNSEEAMARRLELQEEQAELEKDIVETQEDRKFELQENALDKAEKEFEDNINKKIDALDEVIKAHEKEIEQIEKVIEAFEKQIDAIEELKDAIAGGGGGGGSLASTSHSALQGILDDLEDTYDITEDIRQQALDIGEAWLNVTGNIDSAKSAMERYVKYIQEKIIDVWGIDALDAAWGELHTGGTVETHHSGNSFAGNLRSNEVFAKLLAGEYVATEGQMDNFMKNILPKVASEMPAYNKTNYASDTKIDLNMPITVQGNMDKNVMPEIERVADYVIEEINKSLILKGHMRTTDETII